MSLCLLSHAFRLVSKNDVPNHNRNADTDRHSDGLRVERDDAKLAGAVALPPHRQRPAARGTRWHGDTAEVISSPARVV